ncbi:MAG TPA: sulfatase-like hydrolase/transferase, partial [Urbifossiella sp.]|nr:sulfatase-like hydrolase/transferase [Urbifossiella sp.]
MLRWLKTAAVAGLPRRSHALPVLTLLVGIAGGWAAATGRLESVLRAEPAAVPVETAGVNLAALPPIRCEGTGGCQVGGTSFVSTTAQQPKDAKKPNILVIMGDDVGWFNPSCYNRGMLGFTTPNIDRIAAEGALFTTYYGQQSCTAGRAAFITGQCPFRTGLTKVGLPGSSIGLQPQDPTIAELLQPLGYATGQFGKNHLGDKDEFLPTN